MAVQADIKEFLDGRGVQWEEVDDLAAVAGDADVLYQTRIQKERFQAGFRGPWLLPSSCSAECVMLSGSCTVSRCAPQCRLLHKPGCFPCLAGSQM